MRLDGCSPKDGRQTIPGRLAIDSVEDIILRLTTSQRARNDMLKQLEADVLSVEVTFLPFNERMRSQREYRVYCAPGKGTISAVSQYCWHKPWTFAALPSEEQMDIAHKIFCGITQVHWHILGDLVVGDELDDLLLDQGFSFDVFYDEDKGIVELVELNVLGARSGCGSCLFQWINDFDQLYGKKEEVEFRVSW